MSERARQGNKSQRGASRAVGILSVLAIAALYILRVTGVVDPYPYPEPAGEPIEVFFTAPAAGEIEGGQDRLDAVLAADIAAAQASVDVAAYKLDLATLAEALVAAQERGVRVRFVTDSDAAGESAVRRLARAGISVVEDKRGSLMHNKFVVIDREIVWTGSWNLTDSGTTWNDNNAVRIRAARLASNYTTEFEEMFEARAFGANSPANTPFPNLTLTPPGSRQRIRLSTYFAPEDGVMNRVLALVQDAQESVRFMAFHLTDDRLGDLLMEKNRAGVVVQGVLEAQGSDTEYSEYGRLSGAQPPVDLLLDGNPYYMHHKVIIIDEQIVVLGSFNFTESADHANDENLLVIHDPRVAARFGAEFERVYARALAGE